MHIRQAIFPCILAALAQSCPAMAEGISVAPGQWTSTSVIRTQLNDATVTEPVIDSRTETAQSCVSPRRPVLAAADLAGPGCSVSDVWVVSPEMSFVLVCRHADMTLYGTMTASAALDGRSTQAQMTLTGRRGDGQEIRINAELSGAFTGPCIS